MATKQQLDALQTLTDIDQEINRTDSKESAMTIYAYTAPGMDYPAFLNISHASDSAGEQSILITVRAAKVCDKCGEVAVITLPADEWAILVGHLNHHFAMRVPR